MAGFDVGSSDVFSLKLQLPLPLACRVDDTRSTAAGFGG